MFSLFSYLNPFKNKVTNAYNYMRYTSSEKEENYIFKIEINGNLPDEIPFISEELFKINHPLIKRTRNDIIDILKYYIQEEEPKLLEQIDYFLFTRHNLPIIQIQNKTPTRLPTVDYKLKYYSIITNLDL